MFPQKKHTQNHQAWNSITLFLASCKISNLMTDAFGDEAIEVYFW